MARIILEIPCKYAALILFSELCVNLNEYCAKTTPGPVQAPSVWVLTGIRDPYDAVDHGKVLVVFLVLLHFFSAMCTFFFF